MSWDGCLGNSQKITYLRRESYSSLIAFYRLDGPFIESMAPYITYSAKNGIGFWDSFRIAPRRMVEWGDMTY